jgi:hypothetical protein
MSLTDLLREHGDDLRAACADTSDPEAAVVRFLGWHDPDDQLSDWAYTRLVQHAERIMGSPGNA